MFVRVMTDMGMGRMTDTKIGIHIRIRSTPIRIPGGYTDRGTTDTDTDTDFCIHRHTRTPTRHTHTHDGGYVS